MARAISPLLPSTQSQLVDLGGRLRLARLRRGLTAAQVAARGGMAPMTLRSLERGSAGVTIGAYAAVLQVLGLETDLALVAEADPVGRALQDARLPRATPPSARTTPSGSNPVPTPQASASSSTRAARRAKPSAPSAFARATDLATLLDLPGKRAARARR